MKDDLDLILEFLDDLGVEPDGPYRRVTKYICVLRNKIKEMQENACFDIDINHLERTPRGFIEFGELIDTKLSKVWLQQSSADPCDCAWIFCSSDDLNYENPAPHLDKDGALKMIDLLRKYVRWVEKEGGDE